MLREAGLNAACANHVAGLQDICGQVPKPQTDTLTWRDATAPWNDRLVALAGIDIAHEAKLASYRLPQRAHIRVGKRCLRMEWPTYDGGWAVAFRY